MNLAAAAETDNQKALSKLEDQILQADAQLRGLEDQIAAKRAEIQALLQDHDDKLHSFNDRRLNLEAKLKTKQQDLVGVEAEIAERKSYLLEQEEIINRAFVDWNEKLVEIRGEASLAESNRTDILKDIIRHEQQRETLMLELDQKQAKLDQLTYTYEERARDYRDRLKQLEIVEQDKRRYVTEMETKIEARLQNIERREKTIQVTEVVQARTKEELRQKERKLRFDYHLAGEAYE